MRIASTAKRGPNNGCIPGGMPARNGTPCSGVVARLRASSVKRRGLMGRPNDRSIDFPMADEFSRR